MTARPAGVQSGLLLLFSLLIAGCSSSRYTQEYPIGPTTGASRDGVLLFGVPRGWFAAPPDSGSTNIVAWLLRNDFAATLAVSEIVVDSVAGIAVRRGGLEALARMTMTLVTGEHAGVLRRGPETARLANHTFCLYETEMSENGDVSRVAVFFTPSKIYEVTALARGGEEQEQVFAAQEAFLRSLRWQTPVQ